MRREEGQGGVRVRGALTARTPWPSAGGTVLRGTVARKER